MAMPSPFTQQEEQLYEEIVAAVDKHRAAYDRCIKLLQPYLNRLSSEVFPAAEEQAYQELEEQALYHRRELQQCQLRLMPYRDNQNTWDYAMNEAKERGYAQGRARMAMMKAARIALRQNLPLAQIAELTDLTEAEIEALRE